MSASKPSKRDVRVMLGRKWTKDSQTDKNRFSLTETPANTGELRRDLDGFNVLFMKTKRLFPRMATHVDVLRIRLVVGGYVSTVVHLECSQKPLCNVRRGQANKTQHTCFIERASLAYSGNGHLPTRSPWRNAYTFLRPRKPAFGRVSAHRYPTRH